MSTPVDYAENDHFLFQHLEEKRVRESEYKRSSHFLADAGMHQRTSPDALNDFIYGSQEFSAEAR